MNNGSSRLVCVVLLLFVACQRQNNGTVVARVGAAELTLDEALAHVDTSRKPYGDQLRGYIAHWVNDELIYQEAKKNGADKRDDVQRQIRDARRMLTADAFLRQSIDSDTGGINQALLDEYFKNHASEFFVKEDMIKLNLVTMDTREHAGSFAALVSRGMPWNVAVDQIRRDTISQNTIVTNVSGKFFTQHTLFPGELWKVVSALGVNEVSFPVKTNVGYAVLQPLAMLQQGKQAPFELVRDEVRQRVFIERRRRAYNDLLGTLRTQYNVEIIPVSGVSDTIPLTRHE
jgi:hypothetical protein